MHKMYTILHFYSQQQQYARLYPGMVVTSHTTRNQSTANIEFLHEKYLTKLTYRACVVRSQEAVGRHVDCGCPHPWETLKVAVEDMVVDTTCSTWWWWELDDWMWNCW